LGVEYDLERSCISRKNYSRGGPHISLILHIIGPIDGRVQVCEHSSNREYIYSGVARRHYFGDVRSICFGHFPFVSNWGNCGKVT
jgi:hypothetical protein